MKKIDLHSLRARMTAITVAAILTTVAAIVVAGSSTIKQENDRRSVEMMNLIADNAAESIEEYLGSIEQSVETAANLADDTMDSVIMIENRAAGARRVIPDRRTDEQNAAVDAYLEDYCNALQVTIESIASRSYGVIAYYYCISPEVSRDYHGIFYAKTGKTGFLRREPLDAGSLIQEDELHDAWYFETVRRGRPSWIGPYKGESLGDVWLCSYVVPVYDSGTLIGVIGMDIPVETFAGQLKDIKVYDSGFACLFNDEGRVIYHPDHDTGGTAESYGKAFSEEQLSQKSNGNELVRYKTDGRERQMSYTTLNGGMKLAITAPTREINASWRRLARFLLYITIIIIALFAAIIHAVMGLITRPLEDLTAASQRLAEGDYDVELSYDRDDEIGVLTGAFMRMRDRIVRYIQDLRHLVNTDALTDLPNMRCFFGLAEEERARLKEEGRDAVMLYFNMTGISHFNRQYGFDEGDRLLIGFADILRKHFGEERICRMSDDHFAAVAAEEGIGERVDAVIEEMRGLNGGNSLPVCVGIYPYRLGDTDVSEACDRARYICDLHRGEYESSSHVFEAGMIGEVEKMRYIVSHLDKALEEKWVKVCYQPIVRAESGRICDVEALSRWDDPEKGLLSPADFIPLLERSRLIYRLDLYVLDRIIEKIKRQTEDGLTVVPHSLNLSRADFESCDIVEEICRRMDDAGIARDRLTIEITESMVGSDFDFMKAQVQRFQEEGFQVWMDDFGSGYSSLDVLQDIHFDLLKFDMLFLHRTDEGEESRIILRQLAAMAKELGVETICEGVETKEQADFLREIGVTKLQGYYFSRPVPYEEVLRRYRDGTHIGYEDSE